MDRIFELAFPVSKVESKTTGIFFQIVTHLIKIFRYKDNQNKSKHLRDIKRWSEKCCDLMFSSKSKITIQKLKRWYKFNKIDSFILAKIKQLDEKYKLPIIRNQNDVLVIVKKFSLLLFEVFVIVNTDLSLAYNKLNEIFETIERTDNNV